ncbi:hypothetical protein [Fimbriiglobus ruber]|uniref:Uncharacterized protein n=1 Tax=Fimbriiglobus ruber TaxID=1908690 RepID=A0A225EAZ3_9BACT|nr:hypothetical protein [Fimbriiglobus ruber]OWK45715.1 hypothetical protein FRUB_02046 [Fimbriiglobus ruber]
MTPDELCPLCGGTVAEVRGLMHWSEYDGVGGTILGGRCSACDTDLRRRVARGESPAWRALVPPPELLRAAVSAEELPALTARFERVTLFGQWWAEFLAYRQPGDEVWRFTGVDGTEGFAIVRQGRPLTQFLTPDPDFERGLLEREAKQSRSA